MDVPGLAENCGELRGCGGWTTETRKANLIDFSKETSRKSICVLKSDRVPNINFDGTKLGGTWLNYARDFGCSVRKWISRGSEMKNRYSSGMKNGSARESPEAEEENLKSVLKHIVRMIKGGRKGKSWVGKLRNVVEINKRTSSRRIETKAWREICFMLPSTINPETNLVIYTNTSLSVGRCIFIFFRSPSPLREHCVQNKCFHFKSAFKLFLKGALMEMDCLGVWRNLWSLRRFILEL